MVREIGGRVVRREAGSWRENVTGWFGGRTAIRFSLQESTVICDTVMNCGKGLFFNTPNGPNFSTTSLHSTVSFTHARSSLVIRHQLSGSFIYPSLSLPFATSDVSTRSHNDPTISNA